MFYNKKCSKLWVFLSRREVVGNFLCEGMVGKYREGTALHCQEARENQKHGLSVDLECIPVKNSSSGGVV